MARENNIEWIQGDDIATATFQNNRYQSKIRKIAEERPDEVRIMHENEDGSIRVQFPLKWVKVQPSRIYTEQERMEMQERGRKHYEKYLSKK